MNERINLLDPNRDSGPSVFLRRLHKMRLITIGLLFIVSVASVILFILVTLSPLPALEQQQSSLEQQLTRSKSDIVKLGIVSGQADAISGILKTRLMLDVQLGQILSQMPKDMTVTEVRTDTTTIEITVEDASLQSFDTFLNALVAFVQNKKYFNKVVLNELTIDTSNNQYEATIDLSLL